MYIVELYDLDGKKSFIKELSPHGFPASYTKKKTEALQWKDRNQACMYGAKLMTDMYFGVQIISMASSGFKVIPLK